MASEQKTEEKIMYVHPPLKGSITSSDRNIDHCIQALTPYKGTKVIGYYKMADRDNPEILYQLMDKEAADYIKKGTPNFDYMTIDMLAEAKKKVPQKGNPSRNQLNLSHRFSYSDILVK